MDNQISRIRDNIKEWCGVHPFELEYGSIESLVEKESPCVYKKKKSVDCYMVFLCNYVLFFHGTAHPARVDKPKYVVDLLDLKKLVEPAPLRVASLSLVPKIRHNSDTFLLSTRKGEIHIKIDANNHGPVESWCKTLSKRYVHLVKRLAELPDTIGEAVMQLSIDSPPGKIGERPETESEEVWGRDIIHYYGAYDEYSDTMAVLRKMLIRSDLHEYIIWFTGEEKEEGSLSHEFKVASRILDRWLKEVKKLDPATSSKSVVKKTLTRLDILRKWSVIVDDCPYEIEEDLLKVWRFQDLGSPSVAIRKTKQRRSKRKKRLSESTDYLIFDTEIAPTYNPDKDNILDLIFSSNTKKSTAQKVGIPTPFATIKDDSPFMLIEEKPKAKSIENSSLMNDKPIKTYKPPEITAGLFITEAEAYFARGCEYFINEVYQKAEQHLKRAYELSPSEERFKQALNTLQNHLKHSLR
eukprot:TRINITY_DN2135_c0_g1_i1.p1 TRINITY_DN2135_c0_g1~~TRINITY_DN2135_c0_g1_i1.p1  ORF type:complete len:475 (-),score=91.55 TRINITY_DN2135_c0_g1_i1:98-1498(-)